MGDEDHVRTLLGEHVTDVDAQRRILTVDRFGTPQEWRDYVKDVYGPIVAVYRGLGADTARIAALDDDLTALATRHDRGAGSTVLDWEYLLLTARRSGS